MNVSAFYTSVRREKSTFSRFQPANIQQIINVEKFFFSILEAGLLFYLIFRTVMGVEGLVMRDE